MTASPATIGQSAVIIVAGLLCLGGLGWIICKIIEFLIDTED